MVRRWSLEPKSNSNSACPTSDSYPGGNPLLTRRAIILSIWRNCPFSVLYHFILLSLVLRTPSPRTQDKAHRLPLPHLPVLPPADSSIRRAPDESTPRSCHNWPPILPVATPVSARVSRKSASVTPLDSAPDSASDSLPFFPFFIPFCCLAHFRYISPPLWDTLPSCACPGVGTVSRPDWACDGAQFGPRTQEWLCGRACLRYHEAMLWAAVADRSTQFAL